MQSPIAPGRITSLRRVHLLFDHDGNSNIECRRAKTHLCVTGLVVDFAADRSRAWRSIGRRFEFCLNCERTSENAQRLISNLEPFRLWIFHAFRLQRSVRPLQLQRNCVFATRLIAIDMKSGKRHHVKRGQSCCATLDRELLGRLDRELILLRQRPDQRQACEG
jgi:hypothetical protein